MHQRPAMFDWRQSNPSSTSSNTVSRQRLSKSAAFWQSLSSKPAHDWSLILLEKKCNPWSMSPGPTTRDGIRDRAMLHLAVRAGLRASELIGLRIDDVTLQSETSAPEVFVNARGQPMSRWGFAYILPKVSLQSITEKFALSCSPLRVGPEHGHQFVRRSACSFAQM